MSTFPILGLIIVVALFGLLIYWVVNPKKKTTEPVILESMPTRTSTPWYTGLIYLLCLLPFLFGKYLIKFAVFITPLPAFILGILLAIFVGLANWYPPLRKKVNYWLTLQKDERLAYAWSEQTLYGLNGLFVFTAGFLIVIPCLYWFN